jgi:hypothetical protein
VNFVCVASEFYSEGIFAKTGCYIINTEIIIPSGVWDEIVEAGKTDTASQQLLRLTYDRVGLRTPLTSR